MNELFNHTPRVRKLNTLPPNPEEGRGRFPSWLHRPMPKGGGIVVTGELMREKRLHTVCEEAKCPNLLECWSKKTATFLAMGRACTRACGFCDIDTNPHPPPLDPWEPQHIAESVAALGLRHVVVTHVARDDLPDGGAAHFVEIMERFRELSPSTTIELLTFDFNGKTELLDIVLSATPDCLNHNVETVRRLTPSVRHKATYERSLSMLAHASSRGCLTKSGLMVGLGETKEEVLSTLHDLLDAGCAIVTIGQYLQPSPKKLRVKEFIHPDLFAEYAAYGEAIGLQKVFAGPFVRSSYLAAEQFIAKKIGLQQSIAGLSSA